MKLARRIIFSLIFLSILFLCFLFSEEKEDKSLLLQIGERDYREEVLEIFPGQVYSQREGKSVSFLKMIKDMKNSRFVYVGETHNSLPMHDIQFKIIQALFEQDNSLSIGLEMLPLSTQEPLNKWSLGTLTQDEFIIEIEWYINWNYNFGFYEKIFEFAKENKIPLYALNVSRDIIKKIRMKGWDGLSDDEKKLVPQPDLTDEEHRILIRTIFESTEIPHQMKGRSLEMAFEGLYRAQSAWDEVMAFNAVRAVKEKKMIVLAGSGHLLYNLGINRRAYKRSRVPFKTVISLAVPKEKESIEVSRSLADYVWGIPEEGRPAFPSVGLSFKKFKGLDNLVVERKPIDGVAKGANFEKGDVVLSVDGKAFQDLNQLRVYLAKLTWDDETKFGLLRDGREIEVLLKFKMPEKKQDKEKEN
ncbi:MAG: PDZ domain-containing protein [Candidatus Aminicenantes bacterium]|nr:PDZ domain-containing protein [Candidatus Aminicenantes bacterium]